jgi:hypothetical protein
MGRKYVENRKLTGRSPDFDLQIQNVVQEPSLTSVRYIADHAYSCTGSISQFGRSTGTEILE